MHINKKLHTSSRFAGLRAVSKLSTLFLYTLYIVKKGEISDLFVGKTTYVIKKIIKKLHITHYYSYFYFSHFC